MKKTAAENEVAALMDEIKKGNTAKKTCDNENSPVKSGQAENETIVDNSDTNSVSDSATESQPIVEIKAPLLEKQDDINSLSSQKETSNNADNLSLQLKQRGKVINRLNEKVKAQKEVINQLKDNCQSNKQEINDLKNKIKMLEKENKHLQYQLDQLPNVEYMTNELNELNIQLFETDQKLKKYEKDKTMSIACFIEERQEIVHSIAFSIKQFFRK